MSIETQWSPAMNKFYNNSLNKYKARWFFNKQVALALLWIFLMWMDSGAGFTEAGFTGTGISLPFSVSSHPGFYSFIEKIFYRITLGAVAAILSSFFSAWLAGWKFRIIDIIFTGMVIAGIGTLLDSVVTIASIATGTDLKYIGLIISDHNNIGLIISDSISQIVRYLGSGPVLANLFQLAMEQIPEASAAQMSSLINWMVFTAVLGSWSSTLIANIYQCLVFLSANPSSYVVVGSLLYPVIMTSTLSTYSLQKHKLMDNSPSSNVIKNVYQVAKYAVQHKHPQCRSAMTYWEERIPSRLALGKAKYGGPFSSEQVEDVRTFFQIGALYLAAILYLTTLYLNEYSSNFIDHPTEWNRTFYLAMHTTNCYTYSISHHFAGYNYWWLLVSIPIYELLLVPLLGYRMPRMLSRVTFSTLLALLLSIVLTILIIMDSYSNKSYTVSLFGLQVGLSLPMGVARAIFYTAGLEFLCAQSPYAMRNFFISLGICIGWMCPILSGLLFTLWARNCTFHVSCAVIYSVVTIALHIVGLALFWVTIKKYHLRSRGHEDEHQQQWVEKVYDKYVEQEHNFQEERNFQQEQAFLD